MRNNLFQIFIVVLIVVLLVSVSDPFMLFMPPPLLAPVLLAATVLVCVFAGFVLKERTGDEREVLHRLHAGRVAYLSGLAILTLGLVSEGLAHHVDYWIVLALGVMLVAKLVAHLYADTYQ